LSLMEKFAQLPFQQSKYCLILEKFA